MTGPSRDPRAGESCLRAGCEGRQGLTSDDHGLPQPPTSKGPIDQDLVKALAHPLRVKIVEALQGRSASPTEMAHEIPERLGNIVYHVGVLLGVDCIELVGTRRRRATIEHFYTARPRSFIGHQDWRRVPRAVRGGVTDEAMRTFVARFGAAIDAETIERRADTTLIWMPVTVDERGWREVAEFLDATLLDLTRIAYASRERLRSGGAAISLVTGLAALEMATGLGRVKVTESVRRKSRAEPTVNQDLMKALGHPMKVRILDALHGRTASPSDLAREFEASLGVVSYHATGLQELDCIARVTTRPKRGTIEHFCTASPRRFVGQQDWRRADCSIRAGVAGDALRKFVAEIGVAIDADTIDSREDTTLNWMPFTVDEQGWREIGEVLDLARQRVAEVAASSCGRLDGEAGIPAVIGLAAFETAPARARDHSRK